jgi:DNA-binding CsgD family transcriptional regulator
MFTKARNAAWLQPIHTGTDGKAPHQPHLTPRQREVLVLLCQGLSNKMICRRLDIAPGTVKIHTAVILREFGVSSRLQVVVAAHRLGLISDDTEGQEDTGTAGPEALRVLARNGDHTIPGLTALNGVAPPSAASRVAPASRNSRQA